ncbi:PREDICTED: succinate dehydrogenase assembly factor 2, mitochondrial-like isoform X2 [Ipomoea nil]|uniref:succinate dehydrogenase assembly factor 2, mitochondrial-like isoform X2 n=1 Tax=Ipomoea nil TaxID=35883 RepID=UPI000900DEC0|nr:PREDICTED: succinate dehydrogenase assembly factor 2, mitochondrial-like isoform X2 [Ipomoea nil]
MAITRRSLVSSFARILLNPTNQTSPIPSNRPLLGSFSRLCSSNLGIDLSDEEAKRRLVNRLLYRSKQRGYLELDLILGKWVEDHIHSMDETGIKALVHVLDVENPDLWKWLTGQEPAPDGIRTNPVFTSVHTKIMNNLDKHAAPETRATTGQSWVRGWDDFKRGRDSPIAGNQ